MPAVTQLTPNFLGGVSKQNDDKKLEGQVSECINGYPDPTYGLLKRPGMKFIEQLKDSGGTPFNKAALDGAIWFSIDRGEATSYVGAIKGTNIYIWKKDGTWCTVTNTGTSYLTGTTANDYHFRSIQDVTVITNRTVTTAMQAAGSYVADSVATLKLLTLVATYDYTVTIQGISSVSTSQNSTTFDDMLLYDSGNVNASHHMVDAVVATITTQQGASNADFNGTWCIEGYTNSLVIKRFYDSGTPANTPNQVLTDYEDTDPAYNAATWKGKNAAFTIEAKGGLNNDSLEVFEDEVTDVAKLPIESFHGHHVTILNSDSAADDYYVEYVAYNTEKGRGYWKETRARDVSAGIDASTMPHELANTGATTFTFGPLTAAQLKGREAGDTVTNPDPSFIGKKITSTFFYNNRFGVLSEDNIIFGVANDSYNFFSRSALTQVDSDPIDLNVSSVRPVKLIDVLPSPQGLTLFSERQQFQVFSTDTSILTPSNSVVRAISNYEMDPNISPVDVGTSAMFLSQVSSYSKVFSIQLQDVEQNPVVVDISKAVLEWIPSTIDNIVVSPQNSLVVLVDRGSSYLYLFRFYNNGQENLFQAWTKWKLTGTIQDATILNDEVVIISQHEDEYTIQTITLDELPTGAVTATSTSTDGSTCLDYVARPTKPHTSVDAVVFDANNDITKIYTPYTPISATEATVLLVNPATDEGYAVQATPKVESGTNYNYLEAQGDLTSFASGIVIGYKYEFEVTLPTFYFRRNETTTDFTANLTISRVKVSAGRTGALTFKSRLGSSREWTEIKEVTAMDDYGANNVPVESNFLFIVPIHQRNTNFELKVTSDFPYPVSLVSMMWEGNYSPRFYRRA
jgi:hypothetical protein